MTETEALLERFIEELPNRGNLDAADELFAPDFVWARAIQPGASTGAGGREADVRGVPNGFPRLAGHDDKLISENGRAVALVTAQGTNEGELMGRPPIGRPAYWTGVHVLEISDGRIAEDHTVLDQLGLLEQLGHIDS